MFCSRRASFSVKLSRSPDKSGVRLAQSKRFKVVVHDFLQRTLIVITMIYERRYG